MEEPKDIFDSIAPLHNLGKICALNPMKYNRQTDKLEPSKISMGLSIAIGLACSVASFMAQFARILGSNEPISETSFWFDIYSSILIQMMGIIINCVSVRSLAKVVNNFSKIDQLITNAGHRVVHMQVKRFCYIGIACVILEYSLTTFCEMFYYLNSYEVRITLAMSYMPIITNGVIKLQFVTFIYVIKSRFRCLNYILHSMSQHKQNAVAEISYLNLPQYFKEFNRNDSTEKVKIVHNIHNMLYKQCSSVNQLYGFQILIITASAFNIIVNELYYCYSMLINSRYDIGDIYFSVQWSLIQQSEIFILVWVCSATQKESSKTASLLHTLQRMSNNDEELNESIKLFSLHQMHKKVEFTAFGLFPINYTLLLTILSSITSYLVIMVQFDISKPKVNKTQ